MLLTATEIADDGLTLPTAAFAGPKVLLSGPVDYAMYDRFRAQLGQAPEAGVWSSWARRRSIRPARRS